MENRPRSNGRRDAVTNSLPLSQEHSAALRRAGALLVGTASTVRQLRHTLLGAEGAPSVVGCLLPRAVSSSGVLLGGSPSEVAALPVLGDFDDLAAVVVDQAVDLVLVSLPQAMAGQTNRLTQTLGSLGVTWRVMPTLEDQLAGRTNPASRALWAVDPVTLLDRHPRPLDEESIRRTIANRVVLITGAGGSIGSELARIACRFNPSRLVLVERGENALFEIDRDIARRFPQQARAAVLHDVTDAARTLAVIVAQKPDVIFHAAAHKHVPMMEDHPCQAVENNFYGTRAIADAACRVGVGRFVMISSDKAVNPSSVMGATKRLAELYIQYLSGRCETVFAMVRFGNVLGSACSVIPIWAQQLAQGGPITVTHPDMTRYFMTIPEAAGLVLQSAAFAGGAGASTPFIATSEGGGESAGAGGEVFLLDMGRPICILDMARRFLRSQGLEPDRDLKIQITGIRPGEKLFEELAYDSEDMLPTPHESIRLWRTAAPDTGAVRRLIAAFDRLRGHSDGSQAGRHLWQGVSRDDIMAALHSAVPEMVAPATDTAARIPA
jgi:FlaA1/EpsC-like NDP-sugar epimerase